MTEPASYNLYSLAWRRLCRQRTAVICAAIMGLYLVVVLLSALGLLARDWDREVAISYAPPTWLKGTTTTHITVADQVIDPVKRDALDRALSQSVPDPIGEAYRAAKNDSAQKKPVANNVYTNYLWMGADRWGRDVLQKAIHGAQTSLVVGLGAALLTTLIGALLGVVAGYFGGWVDALTDWFYSLFTAIPYLLLILAIAAVLGSSGTGTMILIFGLTGWTGVYRLIRAETLRQLGREYLRAAEAMGVSHGRRILSHILPNTNHIILVQISILTVSFIKSEVILSFLGFGVPVTDVSWGSMLNEAQNELLLGYWWQLLTATLAMAGLVTAWSLFTDVLRDALDPKLK